jgi:glycosyltransferase involved in cell wall biosynthesis
VVPTPPDHALRRSSPTAPEVAGSPDLDDPPDPLRTASRQSGEPRQVSGEPDRRPLRILVATPTFLPLVGGAELGIHEICSRLGRHHHVTILTPNPRGAEADRYQASDDYQGDYEVKRYRIPGRDGLRPVRWLTTGSGIGFIGAASRLLRVGRFDVANFHFAQPQVLPFCTHPSLRRHDVPVVLSLVGRRDVLADAPWALRGLNKAAMERSSIILPNSSFYVDRTAWSDRPNVHVVPFGVDTSLYHPGLDGTCTRRRVGADPGDLVVLAVQRLASVKRVDHIIEAFTLALGEMPNARLVVAGKGPEEHDLKRLAQSLGVAHRVTFTGYVPDAELPGLFAAADVFAMASEYETFGVTLAQALAAGVPIVAARTSCVGSVLDSGRLGLLSRPSSPQHMAQQFLEIARDPRLRLDLADRGRRHAVAHLDWEVIARTYARWLRHAARTR